uniref:Chromosome 8 open reading frame 82 n=1 Tax=Chrysolophus pictus TaxID=9089 RepID=A0A8C3LM07_CHRPC
MRLGPYTWPYTRPYMGLDIPGPPSCGSRFHPDRSSRCTTALDQSRFPEGTSGVHAPSLGQSRLSDGTSASGVRFPRAAMRSAVSLRAAAAAYRRGYGNKAGNGTGNGPKYRQGQSPAPRRREYFYCVDTHGRLFLDDAKVKNFITCFKDERFLAFFFHHLQPNRSGRYEDSFPFLSPCGPEHNFVRCQDLPIVFTRVLEGENAGGSLLSYCGGGARLVIPFQPQRLTFDPENGRLYHPGPEGGGGVGLVKSALVEEWGDGFEYGG